MSKRTWNLMRSIAIVTGTLGTVTFVVMDETQLAMFAIATVLVAAFSQWEEDRDGHS